MEPTATGSHKTKMNNQVTPTTQKRLNGLLRNPSFFSNLHQPHDHAIEQQQTIKTPSVITQPITQPGSAIEHTETHVLPVIPKTPVLPTTQRARQLTPKRAALLIAFLCIVVLQTFNVGPSHFLGSQGWAYVLSDPLDTMTSVPTSISTSSTPEAQLSPEQYIDQLLSKMTVEQKIGQTMMVQFNGPEYSLIINTMISQYHVGSVLLFQANNNILSQEQVKMLNKQIQQAGTRYNGSIPMSIAIDQEGGNVNRLTPLGIQRPSAAELGATNDIAQLKAAGLQDAKYLTDLGININLAPVVDVNTLPGSPMDEYGRTYGTTPETVTKFASAYLQGLQNDGTIIGTLKHFPGLGNIYGDPHQTIVSLNRSKAELEQIDWAPYRTMIKEGNAHAIMVTHELLPAIDNSVPASLSPKVINGVLRQEMGFQGVIMTDSLAMTGITQYYTPEQAAAVALDAGSDMIMGANSPAQLEAMINGIKTALADGTYTQKQLDDSVRRILMMKYHQGLLPMKKK